MSDSMANGLLSGNEAMWQRRAESAEAYKALFRSALAEIAAGSVEDPVAFATGTLTHAMQLAEDLW